MKFGLSKTAGYVDIVNGSGKESSIATIQITTIARCVFQSGLRSGDVTAFHRSTDIHTNVRIFT